MTVKPSVTSGQINSAISARFCAPEWATLFEVRSATGMRGRTSYLDAFTARLWGDAVRTIAFEVKVSRSDFMREIADPSKRVFAETVANECFFAVPAGLVRVDEVPEDWGLMEYTSNGTLRSKKVAKQRTVTPPYGWTLSLLRRITGSDAERALAPTWKWMGRDLTPETMPQACRDWIAAEAAERDRQQLRDARAAEDTAKAMRLLEIVRLALREEASIYVNNLTTDTDIRTMLRNLTKRAPVNAEAASRIVTNSIRSVDLLRSHLDSLLVALAPPAMDPPPPEVP